MSANDGPAIAAGRVRRRMYTFPLYVPNGAEITFPSKITRLVAMACYAHILFSALSYSVKLIFSHFSLVNNISTQYKSRKHYYLL